MKFTKIFDERVGVALSTFFSIISLLLCLRLGLRFFNPLITLIALLFMSVSPMDLEIARRSWQDAMVGGFGLGLIYLCSEITCAPYELIWHIFFVLIGSYFLLVKESAWIIYGLCIIYLLWIYIFNKKFFYKAVPLLIFIILGIGISIAVILYCAGGLIPVAETLSHVKQTLLKSFYAVNYQTGPWFGFILGFWIMSPFVTIFFFIGVVGMFFSKHKKLEIDKSRVVILAIIFFIIAVIAIFTIMPHCQTLRLISMLFVPFYLIGGLGFWFVVLLLKTGLNRFYFFFLTTILIVLTIFSTLRDYQNFKKLFVKKGIGDLSIRLLIENAY